MKKGILEEGRVLQEIVGTAGSKSTYLWRGIDHVYLSSFPLGANLGTYECIRGVH